MADKRPAGRRATGAGFQDEPVYIGGQKVKRENLVAGVNPVLLAEKAGFLKKLFIADDERRTELTSLASVFKNSFKVARDDFERCLDFGGHQNCAGEIFPLPNPNIEDTIPKAEPALVILLDGITDQRNAGAIVRTAAAVGACAVVLPSHGSVRPGPVFYKASAGTAFQIPLCRGLNLSQSLDVLGKHDFWSVAATGIEAADDAQYSLPVSLAGFEFPKRCALVLGSEGKGIREKLEGKCDFRVSIPMAEDVESLNVSVAAGVIAYAWRFSVESRK